MHTRKTSNHHSSSRSRTRASKRKNKNFAPNTGKPKPKSKSKSKSTHVCNKGMIHYQMNVDKWASEDRRAEESNILDHELAPTPAEELEDGPTPQEWYEYYSYWDGPTLQEWNEYSSYLDNLHGNN